MAVKTFTLDADFRQYEGPHQLSEHTKKVVTLSVLRGIIEFDYGDGKRIQLMFPNEAMLAMLKAAND